MNIDYKDLLKKYIAMVDIVHGDSALDQLDYNTDPIQFSDEEKCELHGLGREGYEEYWTKK